MPKPAFWTLEAAAAVLGLKTDALRPAVASNKLLVDTKGDVDPEDVRKFGHKVQKRGPKMTLSLVLMRLAPYFLMI